MRALTTRLMFLAATGFGLGCSEGTEAPTAPATPAPTEGAAAVATDRWITRADLFGTERWGLAAAVVRNPAGETILYAIGGKTAPGFSAPSLGNVQSYNPVTNRWTFRASLPRALRWTNGAGVINGKIYLSGGRWNVRGVSEHLYMYDPATNQWTRKRDMPGTSELGITGVINGKLYVLTGCDQEECFPFVFMAFYRYDPATDQWATLPIPSQPTPSSSHQGGVGGVIAGKFYAVGGQGTGRLDVYDPATNQWTQKATMPRVCGLAAGLGFKGKLYVVGGNPPNPGESCTQIYDPATDTWTTGAAAPSVRVEAAAGRIVVNGQLRIALVGGARPGNNLHYIP